MDAGERNIAMAVAALIVIAVIAILLLSGSKPAAPPANQSNNITAAPGQNISPPANETQPAPAANPTPPVAETNNESIGALLSDGLKRGDARFEAEKGPYIYDMNVYSWRLSGNDSDPPDLMPLKKNDLNVSYIRFPDHYIDSLRGFAFKAYQPQQLAGPMKLFGVAVFLSNETPLDAYISGGLFNMNYALHPLEAQTLEGCSILNSTVFLTPTGSNIKVYDFRCKIMYGASP
jgi:hypothetical protein